MNAVTSVLSGKAIETNQRGLLTTLCFMIQLAPATLWGEAMHRSGFFSHVVKILNDDKVVLNLASWSWLMRCCTEFLRHFDRLRICSRPHSGGRL